MTNRDALIQGLSNHSKDCDVYTVEYIACPYRTASDCVNMQQGIEAGTKKYYDLCSECKADWLEKEW